MLLLLWSSPFLIVKVEPCLLAKKMGGKVKDFFAMKTLMECLFLLI